MRISLSSRLKGKTSARNATECGSLKLNNKKKRYSHPVSIYMLHATHSMAKPKPVIRILSYKRESDLAFRWYGQQHTFVPEYVPKEKEKENRMKVVSTVTKVELVPHLWGWCRRQLYAKKRISLFPFFLLCFFCRNSYWTWHRNRVPQLGWVSVRQCMLVWLYNEWTMMKIK